MVSIDVEVTDEGASGTPKLDKGEGHILYEN